jgi:hypothetical protein
VEQAEHVLTLYADDDFKLQVYDAYRQARQARCGCAF